MNIVMTVRSSCELETYIVAVERIKEYTELPSEVSQHFAEFFPCFCQIAFFFVPNPFHCCILVFMLLIFNVETFKLSLLSISSQTRLLLQLFYFEFLFDWPIFQRSLPPGP